MSTSSSSSKAGATVKVIINGLGGMAGASASAASTSMGASAAAPWWVLVIAAIAIGAVIKAIIAVFVWICIAVTVLVVLLVTYRVMRWREVGDWKAHPTQDGASYSASTRLVTGQDCEPCLTGPNHARVPARVVVRLPKTLGRVRLYMCALHFGATTTSSHLAITSGADREEGR